MKPHYVFILPTVKYSSTRLLSLLSVQRTIDNNIINALEKIYQLCTVVGIPVIYFLSLL